MQGFGIHHVTAIAGPARRNLDFYTRTLGLRLVKRTVNFDDPGTYHFYFGDETGRPGTIVTFFPWAHAAPGRLGTGEAQEAVFRVPEGALGYWTHRLTESGVVHEMQERFGETVLAFRDPDGLRLALAAVSGAGDEPAGVGGGVPAGHAIRGLHAITLLVGDPAPTGGILSRVLGFAEAGREGGTVRFKVDGTGPGGIVDVRAAGGLPRGRMGAGTVHHVAFRATDDTAQAAMAAKLADAFAIRTTEQKDRNYFRSVYFREPGGVLFEIATDGPGFTVDEPAAALGQALKLPPALEEMRGRIETLLPVLV